MPRPRNCGRGSKNQPIDSGIPPGRLRQPLLLLSEDLARTKRFSSVFSWLKVIPRRRVCCHSKPKIPGAARRIGVEPAAEDEICSARHDQDMQFGGLVRELDRITN